MDAVKAAGGLGAEHRHVPALETFELAAVIGMRERPPHVLRPAMLLRVARGPQPR